MEGGREGLLKEKVSCHCYGGCFSLHPIMQKAFWGSRESSNCICYAHINITRGQATSIYKEDFVYSK
uniref:Uncharacterized protein n=1 Tax=Sus scrofa TaxID=9823 RepID=A0A8D1L0B4_PIG